VGTIVRLSGKTSVDVAGEQMGLLFDKSAQFRDLSLRDQLSRTTRRLESEVRFELTPLTRFTVGVDGQRTRFPFSADRDATGLRLTTGLEFKPLALISGVARVGILRFRPIDTRQPGFLGPVASVDLGYTLRGLTRFSGAVSRDLGYSVDNLKTYYMQTGVSAGVSRQLTDRWDAGVNWGRQWLESRSIIPAASSALTDGSQNLFLYQGTVGYHFSRGLRLGVNAGMTRRSGLPSERYQSVRIFGSVVYGL
jgi:hypothetical protein